MNIIIAINDNYLLPAKTMLFSLFLNNKRNIKIYLLYTNLSKQTITELEQFAKKYEAVLILIRIDASMFEDAPKVQWWSEEMYYRLLAFHFIDEDKALWLDSDIIINHSIAEFYNTDISNKMAMVCEGVNQSGVQRLGLPDTHQYFNSGVILFNLAKIRERYTVDDVIKLLKKYKAQLVTPDQDILNIMFSGMVSYADAHIYNHESFGNYVYTQQECNQLHNQTVIIHFNGPYKPWNWKNANWAGDIWWKYAKYTYGICVYLKYVVLHLPVRMYYQLREYYYMVSNKLKLFRR